MEKKLLKKIIALLMIITIMATDFFVLGSNLISYAATLDGSTNNDNIEFSVYFKNENGTRVDNINESIKKEDLKLYAEIKVKNEGYFNGSIELQESNFKIKNNILSSDISNIEENKVNLKQINAGATVEIELDIEPVISETIKADELSMNSTIKLTGQYMETTYKGLDIEATKTIKANFEIDESASAELTTDIITNDVISLNGANKRIVQLLIKSRLSDNQYPVSQTTLEIEVPQLSLEQPEEVKILSLGTKATNGKADYNIEDYKNENGKLQITLKNEPDEENNITWNKNSYDELVVTLIYSEDVDASTVEIKTNSEITLYNSSNTYTAEYTKGIQNQSLNKTISAQINLNTEGRSKGYLYANARTGVIIGTEYNTTTRLDIINPELVDRIEMHEGADALKTENNTELIVNTEFIETKINKEKMLSILGQDGSIQINDGETIQNITKDTEADESGDIIINYETAFNEITIITSKPVNAGVLELKHTKTIIDSPYTVEQLKTVNQLIVKNTISGIMGENTVLTNSAEGYMQLKETKTEAELSVSRDTLSTMTTNNEVILGVKLITCCPQYDLYKNPTIKIQLPKSVETINVNSINPLYLNGFDIKAEYDETNKIISIKLEGEQLDYPEEETEAYIQINLNMEVSKLTPSSKDKIVMTYTNENATQYAGGRTDMGVIEKEIKVISPSGLIPVNNIETYDIEGIGGISQDKQLANVDKNTAGGTDVKFDVSLVNNTQSDVNNVKILGILPTSGEFTYGTETIKNTFTTTLKSEITASKATVYYTNNMNATSDINDSNNGWKQNLSEVSNPRAYLIIIPAIAKAETFSTTYTVTLPSTLDYELTSYAGYQVIYNEGTDTTAQKVESILVGITTGEGIKLESTLSATVGNEILNNGDTVKVGEVIRYTATVKNNGTQTLENVVIKGGVPEGTVYVEPNRGTATDDQIGDDTLDADFGYVYSGNSYYLEKTEIKEVTQTIPSLIPGQEYTMNYEVRVNTNGANSTQLSNKAVIAYQEFSIDSNELKVNTTNSNIRVTFKPVIDERTVITPGGNMQYYFFIENLSNEILRDLNVEIIAEGIDIKQLKDEGLNLITVNDLSNIKVDEIAANGILGFYVPANVQEDASNIYVGVKVTDSNNDTYRSNFINQKISKKGAQIELVTPNNGGYVEIGEKIQYRITLKNTSEYATALTLVDNVPEDLKIEQVLVNDEVKMQTRYASESDTYIYNISNNFKYNIQLEPEEETIITLFAKVRYTEEQFETRTIKNSAQVKIGTVQYGTTGEVTHIIKGKTEIDVRNIVSGIAWLDENQNGQKDSNERLLSNINVKLFDILTSSIAKDKDGNLAETVTNERGEYSFSKIEDGKYIVLFEFDRTQYELTEYMKNGVEESQNSNVILKSIQIDGKEEIFAVTDTIELTDNISNINMGLKENLIFDLELNKYISRISIQNQNGTKTYEYNDSVFQKVEINRKQLNNSVVVLEYTIRVKNAGEMEGNVNSIVDYLPNGLEFSSELNPDWYLSGQNLHIKSLANDKIQPGETREIKLILTKKMTENNVGLINNRAEIEECFNDFGKADKDSTPNNLVKNEDDLGTADVIISISTGAKTIGYTTLILINTGLITCAIYLIFKKQRGKI